MINLLGIAGSGKSTQGRLLAEYLHCPWVSMGQILREHVDEKIQKIMLEGKIIDDNIALPLVYDELKAQHADSKECILDGCPRTLAQAEWLAQKIKAGEIKMTAVIHLEMDPKIAHDRLLARGRHDDHEAAIAERFSEYKTTILPILDYLEQQGIKVYHISGEGSIEQVAARIHEVLKV